MATGRNALKWCGVLRQRNMSYCALQRSVRGIQESGTWQGGCRRWLGSSSRAASRTKALYDGECAICMKEIKFLRWYDKKSNRIEFVNIAEPGYDPDKHSNIAYTTAMGKMHVIGADGQIHIGLDATVKMYDAVGLGWVWGFLKLPGFSRAGDVAYNWFARNRLWLSGRPECEDGTCQVKKDNSK